MMDHLSDTDLSDDVDSLRQLLPSADLLANVIHSCIGYEVIHSGYTARIESPDMD